MKKILLCVLVIVTLLFSIAVYASTQSPSEEPMPIEVLEATPTPEPPPENTPVPELKPNTYPIFVNGEQVDVEAYNYDGLTIVTLRDLVKLFDGCELTFDQVNETINLNWQMPIPATEPENDTNNGLTSIDVEKATIDGYEGVIYNGEFYINLHLYKHEYDINDVIEIRLDGTTYTVTNTATNISQIFTYNDDFIRIPETGYGYYFKYSIAKDLLRVSSPNKASTDDNDFEKPDPKSPITYHENKEITYFEANGVNYIEFNEVISQFNKINTINDISKYDYFIKRYDGSTMRLTIKIFEEEFTLNIQSFSFYNANGSSMLYEKYIKNVAPLLDYTKNMLQEQV